jgi:hypothetical protein
MHANGDIEGGYPPALRGLARRPRGRDPTPGDWNTHNAVAPVVASVVLTFTHGTRGRTTGHTEHTDEPHNHPNPPDIAGQFGKYHGIRKRF